MRHVTDVAGRELRGLFVSPVAYGVLALFAVLSGVFFIASTAFFSEWLMRLQSFQAFDELARWNGLLANDPALADFLPLGLEGGVIGLARDRATGVPMSGVEVIPKTPLVTSTMNRYLSEDQQSFNSTSTGTSGLFILVDLRTTGDEFTADIGNGEIDAVSGTAGSTNDALFVMVLNVPAG